MKAPIPINLAVEDSLSEAIIRVLLLRSNRSFAVGTCYGRGGYGYLKKTIGGFNNAAKGTPFIVLTDLDTTPCPPALIQNWISKPLHHNLLFRIAVREVESWVLAHASAFAAFLSIDPIAIPSNTDGITDPKKFLIKLASKSPKSGIRKDIIPPPGSLREQGPDYNGRLIEFIQSYWSPAQARKRSDSLARTIDALNIFTPMWRRR